MEIRVTPKNDPRTVFASVNSGDTVFFESGIYRFTEPIVISGKKDIRIKGDGAVITGCTVIQGEWKEYREGILLTKTRSGLDIQQLYVNGRKYVMARYPRRIFRGRAVFGESVTLEKPGNRIRPRSSFIRMGRKRLLYRRKELRRLACSSLGRRQQQRRRASSRKSNG